MSNEQHNPHAKQEANQDDHRPPNQAPGESSVIMGNFGKILITICGVQMAAIVFGSLMIWGFVEKIPDMLSQQHDAIIRLEVKQEFNAKNIAANTSSQHDASIERKAMTKAITMMAGDVKHLRQTVEAQGERQDAKLDTLGRYWQQFNTSATQ